MKKTQHILFLGALSLICMFAKYFSKLSELECMAIVKIIWQYLAMEREGGMPLTLIFIIPRYGRNYWVLR